MIIDRKLTASVAAGSDYTLIALPSPPEGYLARLAVIFDEPTAAGEFTVFCDPDRLTETPAAKLSDFIYQLFSPMAFSEGSGQLISTPLIATPVSIPFSLPAAHRVSGDDYLVLAIKHDQPTSLDVTVSYCIVEVSSAL
jgi:hypothetical protein